MKTTLVQPYLFFGGRCDEALEFYRNALGAQIDFMIRYDESPEAPKPGTLPPGFAHKVMHTTFRIGDSILMGSDGCELGAKFSGFSLSLSVSTEAEAKRIFAALSSGGTVGMPMAKTFWSPCFGMVTDQFGIGWMVSVPGQNP